MINPALVMLPRLIPRPILLTCARFKGHNKWSNIRHTKVAKDVAKGKLINRHLGMIKFAITSGGGNIDPKINDKLADAITAARKDEVPASTIERALKRAAEKKSKPFLFELIGPGSSYILLEGESDNIGNTRTMVKSLLRQFKGHYNWARENALKNLFVQRGVVRISKIDKDGNPIDFDHAEEIGIEAGAEEVIRPEEDNQEAQKGDQEEKKNDQDSDEAWELMCPKDDLYSIKGYIEKNCPNVVIKEYCVEYMPMTYIDISDQDGEKLSEILDSLEEITEITKVYVNIK